MEKDIILLRRANRWAGSDLKQSENNFEPTRTLMPKFQYDVGISGVSIYLLSMSSISIFVTYLFSET